MMYSPPDIDLVADAFGAACGHCALAAAIGVPVQVVIHACWGGDLKSSHVNFTGMQAAIRLAGDLRQDKKWSGWPRSGVALIQWTGRWMDFPRWACTQRHWVASKDGMIWDVNNRSWLSVKDWGEFVMDYLMPKEATGWMAFRGIEVYR